MITKEKIKTDENIKRKLESKQPQEIALGGIGTHRNWLYQRLPPLITSNL